MFVLERKNFNDNWYIVAFSANKEKLENACSEKDDNYRIREIVNLDENDWR